MPTRWVINPVIEEIGPDARYRYPKVSTLLDPGRPGKTYEHLSVIHDDLPWCLSRVRGANMSTLDAQPDCLNLLEEDDGLMARTIADLGWSPAKRQRVQARLEAKGVDTSGYTAATRLGRIVRDLGRVLQADYPGPEVHVGE